LNLQWPNIEDFADDKNQDLPEEGELLDSSWDRVSDLGIPLSEEGEQLLQTLGQEEEKRNQDMFHMSIYNDWNGWGLSECFENFVRAIPAP
jgi:hypothetical protein